MAVSTVLGNIFKINKSFNLIFDVYVLLAKTNFLSYEYQSSIDEDLLTITVIQIVCVHKYTHSNIHTNFLIS